MSAIGPALEVFLTAVGLVLFALVGLGVLLRPFWPRIVTYFRRWHERDMRLEQQQREEAECRHKAQMEMREYCHDDILQNAAPSAQASSVHEGSVQENSVQENSAQAVPVQVVPILAVAETAVKKAGVAEAVVTDTFEVESVQRIGSERNSNEA